MVDALRSDDPSNLSPADTSESAGLDVEMVGFGYSPQEVHRVGVAQVVVESAEDESLGLENLRLGESVVGDVDEVLHVRESTSSYLAAMNMAVTPTS